MKLKVQCVSGYTVYLVNFSSIFLFLLVTSRKKLSNSSMQSTECPVCFTLIRVQIQVHVQCVLHKACMLLIVYFMCLLLVGFQVNVFNSAKHCLD